MDATTARLVDYTLETDFHALPAHTVHECKRRLIDSFACAVGAYAEPASAMARAVAKRYPANSETLAASVWGQPWQVMPEAATFANGTMLRFQDMSDTSLVKSRGHPSDVIAGVVAAGEAMHADGASVVAAVTIAYDLYCSFCEAIDIIDRGLDNPVLGVAGCALGAGKLLKLNREQLGNALAIALSSSMALEQTRSGDISSWKGVAAANLMRNAVFSAFLARDGFEGPTAIIEGKSGLWDLVGRFDWDPRVAAGAPHRVALTHLKSFPICYHGQAAAWAAIDARKRVQPETIRDIHVETYAKAVRMMGNDPSRWAPGNRETADHSLPYVVAVSLLDGKLTSDSFADSRLTDAAVTRLMAKVKVSESPELTARFPDAAGARLHIHLTTGETVINEVTQPKGHAGNPLNDAELEAKFHTMFRVYGSAAHGESVLRGLWQLDQAPDIRDALQLLLPPSGLQAVAR